MTDPLTATQVALAGPLSLSPATVVLLFMVASWGALGALKAVKELRGLVQSGGSNGNGAAAAYLTGRDAGAANERLDEVVRALNDIAASSKGQAALMQELVKHGQHTQEALLTIVPKVEEIHAAIYTDDVSDRAVAAGD